MRENIYYTRDFAQSCNVAVRDVCHMDLAEEWKYVMLAERVKLYVLDGDRLLVVFLEFCGVEYSQRIHVVTACEFG